MSNAEAIGQILQAAQSAVTVGKVWVCFDSDNHCILLRWFPRKMENGSKYMERMIPEETLRRDYPGLCRVIYDELREMCREYHSTGGFVGGNSKMDAVARQGRSRGVRGA